MRFVFISIVVLLTTIPDISAQTAAARPWLELAQDHLNDGNPEQALQALDRFRQINQRDIPQSYYMRALSERALNRADRALATIAAYKQSNQVAPAQAAHASMLALEQDIINQQRAEQQRAEQERLRLARAAFERDVRSVVNQQTAREFLAKYRQTPARTDAEQLLALSTSLDNQRPQLAEIQSLNRMQRNTLSQHQEKRYPFILSKIGAPMMVAIIPYTINNSVGEDADATVESLTGTFIGLGLVLISYDMLGWAIHSGLRKRQVDKWNKSVLESDQTMKNRELSVRALEQQIATLKSRMIANYRPS